MEHGTRQENKIFGVPSAKQEREGNMKNAKRIIEKFDSWKYDIYENNRSTWTNQDDSDVLEIEKLLEQQASERAEKRVSKQKK